MNALWMALSLVVSAAAPAGETVRVEWSEAIGTESEIASVRRAYVAAANESAALLATFYQPDALAIFDANGLVSGSEAVGEYLARARGGTSAIVSLTFTPRQFAVEGSVGSECGSFVEITRGERGPTAVEGLYVTIYSRRDDGRWRIAMELRTRSGQV